MLQGSRVTLTFLFGVSMTQSIRRFTYRSILHRTQVPTCSTCSWPFLEDPWKFIMCRWCWTGHLIFSACASTPRILSWLLVVVSVVRSVKLDMFRGLHMLHSCIISIPCWGDSKLLLSSGNVVGYQSGSGENQKERTEREKKEKWQQRQRCWSKRKGEGKGV